MLSYGVSMAVVKLGDFPPRTDLDQYGPVGLVVTVVIFGPIIETLLFQALPTGIGRALKWRRRWQFLVTMLPFAAVHFLIGLPTGMSAGLVGGSYFAFTYLKFRDASFAKAVAATSLVHGCYNLVAVALILASGGGHKRNAPTPVVPSTKTVQSIHRDELLAPAIITRHL